MTDDGMDLLGRWRIEASAEGIPLVFGDGKYPHDPPRVASELESALATAYAGAVDEAERLREAIGDALADLMPGFAPYSLLKDAYDSPRGR